MLIGRETERQTLARLVAGARVGQSAVLLIVGEAGIGKTALLGHAAELAENMTVLRASGSEAESDLAFGCLLQLLRPQLSMLGAISAYQAKTLEIALGLEAGEAGDRFAIGVASLSLLSRIAEDQPLLVLIDDAHLVDQSTAQTILFVARRLVADRVMLLIATRESPGNLLIESDLPRLRLGGLDLASADQLVASSASTPLSRNQLVRLHRTTGGNPLAMVELARDVDALERTLPHTPLPVPETVARSFARRAESLSKPAQTALLVLAVSDGDLPLAARVCAVMGVDISALSEAEPADLIRIEPGRAHFRHPLVSSAIYRSASPADRRHVHQLIATALPEHDLERRAWHLAEAAVGPDEQTAEMLQRAGDRAGSRGAYAVAATAYGRAAGLTSLDAARAERFVKAARCAWLAGQRTQAVEFLDLCEASGAPARLRTAIYELRGVIAARTGSLVDARKILTSAVDDVSEFDADAALVLVADALDVCFYLGDAATASTLVKKADELLCESTVPRSRVLANIAVGMAQVLAGEPGIDRIRSAVDELTSAPLLDDDPLRHAWLILGPLFIRESQSGRELVDRVVDEQRRRTALGSLPFLLFHKARDDATTDRWAQAEADYQESIRLARETGQTTDLAMSLAGLAWLQARCGQRQACGATATEAAQLCRQYDIHIGLAWAKHAIGELHLGLGAAVEAAAEFAALERLLTELGVRDVDLSPGPELVDALLRIGKAPEAEDVARRYYERALVKGQPWALARGERARGSVATVEAMDAHFRRALEQHRSTNDAFETARTHLNYGSRLRRARRRIDARAHLRSALRAFEYLGAKPWADFAAAELTATGETAHRRGTSTRDLLTGQELQIAQMLAAGRTTKQVAAALFLSPKTVEYHLRNVYSKLQISSRAELAARLR